MDINKLRDRSLRMGLTTTQAKWVFEHMDALEAALRALVSSEYDGSRQWLRMDPESGEYKTQCNYCGAVSPLGEAEDHDYDCPVIVALRLLEDGD